MNTKTKTILIICLIGFGVVSRFLPHPSNFTPVVGIAIFASYYFGLRYSTVAVLAIMLLSDIFIGFYHWEMMAVVYGSMLAASAIGSLTTKPTAVNVFMKTLGSSLLFYLVTNWAVWQFGTMYEKSLSGLMQSYMMAIPFFKNSLAGDIFYTSVLFGAVYLATFYPVLKVRWLQFTQSRVNLPQHE